MKSKKIAFELVHDIPTLIRLQEYSLQGIRKAIPSQRVLDFQEDILRVLKVINQLNIVNLDGN